MANGMLVRVLIHTDVTKYLYFKAVDGSFVFNKAKVHLCFFPLLSHGLHWMYYDVLIALLLGNSSFIGSQGTFK